MTSDTDGPKDNKNLKWAMGGVAAVAVLATVVAAVLLFGDGGSGGPQGGSDNGPGQETAAVASAMPAARGSAITPHRPEVPQPVREPETRLQDRVAEAVATALRDAGYLKA